MKSMLHEKRGGDIEYPNVTYVKEDMEVYYNDGALATVFEQEGVYLREAQYFKSLYEQLCSTRQVNYEIDYDISNESIRYYSSNGPVVEDCPFDAQQRTYLHSLFLENWQIDSITFNPYSVVLNGNRELSYKYGMLRYLPI